MFELTTEASFAALFAASFLAATVLPGGSELVLVTVLHRHPEALWTAVAVATVGNTLGAMTSYGIGRLIPNRVQHRSVIYLHRYGYWSLLFTWVPLAGDALAIAAGWLRLNPWASMAAIAAGKFVRSDVVAAAWTGLAPLFVP